MRHFIRISKYAGTRPHLVQGAGGNTSVKSGQYLIVKSSGTLLKNVSLKNGYVTCLLQPVIDKLSSIKIPTAKKEMEFDAFAESQMVQKRSFGIPSIEISLHATIPSKYILHTHSVYLNILSCMQSGQRLISQIFKDTPFYYLKYVNPGLQLGVALSKNSFLPKVIILENHGVITHSDRPEETVSLLNYLEKKVINYLKSKNTFDPFTVNKETANLQTHLFPDSVVYSQIDFRQLPEEKKNTYHEICSAHNHIVKAIGDLGEEPRFLSQTDIEYILSMQKEKYRINKLKHS